MKNIVNELKKNLKGMKKVIASLLIVCMVAQGTLAYCYADDFDVQPKELAGSEAGFVEGSDDPDNSEVGNINNPVGENETEENIASPSSVDEEGGDGDDSDDVEEGGDETPDITDYEDEPTGEETPADETPTDELASPSNTDEEEGSEENNSDDNNIVDEPEEGEQQGGEQEGEQQGDGQQGQQENGEGLGTLFNVQEVGNEQDENNGGKSLLGGNSTTTGFEDYTVLNSSTTGQSLSDGSKYIVESDITCSYTGTNGYGLYINGDVEIYIPEGKTLTCTGGNPSGIYAGGCGIEVISGKTLTIWGKGTLIVKGGAAAAGSAGGSSTTSVYQTNKGGAGGGGAGACIGTRGGPAGAGGAAGGFNNGGGGGTGSRSNDVGTINIYDSLKVYLQVNGTSVTGGASGTVGSISQDGGGGGGGGGFRGALIGSGGSGGGGGGGSSANKSVYGGCGGGGGIGNGGGGKGTVSPSYSSENGVDGGNGSLTSAGNGGGSSVHYYGGNGGGTSASGSGGTLNTTSLVKYYVRNGGTDTEITTLDATALRAQVSDSYVSGDGKGPTTINTDAYKTKLKYNKNSTTATDPSETETEYTTWVENTVEKDALGMTCSGYKFAGWYKEAACTNAFTFGVPLDSISDVTIYAKWNKLTEIKATTPSDIEYSFKDGDLKINFNESYNADSTRYIIENYNIYKCDDADGNNPSLKHTETTSATSYDYPVPASDYLDVGSYYYYAEVSYADSGTANAFTVKSNVIKVTITKKTNQAPNVSELGMSATNASKGSDDGTITGFPTAHSFIEYRHYNHNTGTYGSWSGGDGSSSATGLACGNYEIRYKEDSNNKVSATSSIAVYAPVCIDQTSVASISTVNEEDAYDETIADNSYPKAKYRLKSGEITGLTLDGDTGRLHGSWKLAKDTTHIFVIEGYNTVDGVETTDTITYTVTVNGVGDAPVPGGSDLPSIEQKPDKGSTSSGTIIATLSSLMEYSIDDKNTWIPGPCTSIPNVPDGTIVYIRYKENTSTGDPASKCIEYKVDYGTIAVSLADNTTEYGYASGAFKLQASETKTKSGYSLKKVTYYKCDDTSFANPVLKATMSSPTYTKDQMLSHSVETGLTVATPGPDYYYYGEMRYENSDGSDVFTVTTNVATATIEKKTTTAPATSLFTITNASKGLDDGKIAGLYTPSSGTPMEYRYYNHKTAAYEPADPNWTSVTDPSPASSTTTIENLKAGKYEVRYKEDGNNKESPATELIVYAPAYFSATSSVTSFNEQDIYSFTFEEKSYPTASFKIQSGSLPSGMTFDTSTGKLSGEWKTVGTYDYTLRAYNTIKVGGVNTETYDDVSYHIVVSAVSADPRTQGTVKDIQVTQPKGTETEGTIIASLSTAMEYSIDGKTSWVTCPAPVAPATMSVITGIPDGITVYIRYKATTDPSTGDPIPASKCIEIPINYSSFTATSSGNKAEYGYSSGALKVAAKEGNKTSGYTLKEVKYYSVSSTSLASPVLKETKSSDTYTTAQMLSYEVETGLTAIGGTDSDGKYYYYAELTYKKGDDIRTVSTNAATITVEKKTTTVPANFTITDCTGGSDNGSIQGFATSAQWMEYRYYDHTAITPAWETTWTVKNDGTDTVSSLKAGKYQVRYKEDDNNKASASIELSVYGEPLLVNKMPKINGTAITSTTSTANVDDYLGGDNTTSEAYQFTAKGYPIPTYKISSGTLPSGISLSSDGKMKGVFSTAGTYTFTVQAYNTYRGATHTSEETYKFIINELTDPVPTVASLSVAKATTQGSVGQIKLKYDSTYEYSLDGKATWIQLSTTGPDAEGYFTISNIPQGTTVYIRVKADTGATPARPQPSKSYSIDIGKYVAPVTPVTPSGGGSSGGSGGGGSISGIVTEDQKQAAAQAAAAQKKANDRLDPANATTITMNGSTTQVVNQDAGNVNWVYEPTTNKWKLSINNQTNLNNQLQQENNQGNIVKSGFVKLAKAETKLDINGIPKTNVVASTYFFNEAGEMHIGWLTTGDLKTYYFEPAQTPDQGKMVSGWKEIETKWFYFDSSGALLRNSLTPDGHKVDENGVWVK